jgi:hypothetical protein
MRWQIETGFNKGDHTGTAVLYLYLKITSTVVVKLKHRESCRLFSGKCRVYRANKLKRGLLITNSPLRSSVGLFVSVFYTAAAKPIAPLRPINANIICIQLKHFACIIIACSIAPVMAEISSECFRQCGICSPFVTC